MRLYIHVVKVVVRSEDVWVLDVVTVVWSCVVGLWSSSPLCSMCGAANNRHSSTTVQSTLHYTTL